MMISHRLKEMEKALARQSYVELAQSMKSLTTDDLVGMLEAKSIKVGDTAAGLLSQRNETAPIIEAFLGGRIRTRNGKVRGSNVLQQRGSTCLDALPVYELLVEDRNDEVMGQGLFGLVFKRQRSALPKLRRIESELDPNSKRRQELERAISALEADNPFIYSPNYGGGKEWGVEKIRPSSKDSPPGCRWLTPPPSPTTQ